MMHYFSVIFSYARHILLRRVFILYKVYSFIHFTFICKDILIYKLVNREYNVNLYEIYNC